MNKWYIAVIVLLSAIVFAMQGKIASLNKDYETAMANIKSFDKELSVSLDKNVAYKLTIAQLGYMKDSVIRELNKTKEELKIKDKRLKSMHSVSSVFTKTDTITLRDTLFSSPSQALDTLVGDNWCSVRIGIQYPSTIAVKPTFKSSKHIIVSTRKETVNPPKKFFLARWFQKKHTILNVDVVEKNPYVENESSKFIEILK